MKNAYSCFDGVEFHLAKWPLCGANGLGLCVFVDGVRSCCCDAECDTVFGDCCADKRSCCDERKTERRFGERRERTSAARIEARARRG